MPKKTITAKIICAVVVFVVSGALVLWANKFVRWEGFIPRDVYFEGKETSRSAPIGGFILITVGVAFIFWSISCVLRFLERRRDKMAGLCDEKPPEDKSDASANFPPQ